MLSLCRPLHGSDPTDTNTGTETISDADYSTCEIDFRTEAQNIARDLLPTRVVGAFSAYNIDPTFNLPC